MGYGIPFLALSTILILRRRGSAVSKDALKVGCLQTDHPSRRCAPQGEDALVYYFVAPDLIRGPGRQAQVWACGSERPPSRV